MSLYQIALTSRDVLAFRGGLEIGTNWPMPSTFHSAMMSSMYRKWSQLNEDYEQQHTNRRRKDKNFESSRMRFGGLKTIGPFPAIGDEIYFPTPLDLLPDGHCLYPSECRGKNNLPAPLSKILKSVAPASKKELGPWISATELKKYLQGNCNVKTEYASELFMVESRPGIEIDPETSATVKGLFFNTEYIRMLDKKGAQMMAFAELESKKYKQTKGVDLLEKFFEERSNVPFIFGGQCGTAYMECKRNAKQNDYLDLLNTESVSWGNRIKWVLLSPALFSQGWLPGFIENGQVKIKKGEIGRQEEETRIQWRERLKSLGEIKAKLVAARIGKSISWSGWKLDKDSDNAGGGPKATRHLVPSGSVYYFETNGPEESYALAQSLTGRTKSDELGEQGFGFGVCCPY